MVFVDTEQQSIVEMIFVDHIPVVFDEYESPYHIAFDIRFRELFERAFMSSDIISQLPGHTNGSAVTFTITLIDFKDRPVKNMLNIWCRLISEVSPLAYHDNTIKGYSAKLCVARLNREMTKLTEQAYFIMDALPVDVSLDSTSDVIKYSVTMRGVIKYGPEFDARANELLNIRRLDRALDSTTNLSSDDKHANDGI